MVLVLRSTSVTTVRRAQVPARLAPLNDARPCLVANAARYQSIGSLQALALAVVASVVTPALLWLAL